MLNIYKFIPIFMCDTFLLELFAKEKQLTKTKSNQKRI